MTMERNALMAFPPVWWWALNFSRKQITPDTALPFRKMSGNNRYRIAAANGPLLLTIPVAGGREQRRPLHEIYIDYRPGWQQQHWRSLFSAYGRAPFFAHYGPSLEALLRQRPERLADFSLQALRWAASALKLDLSIDPVSGGATELMEPPVSALPYPQVFDDRHGFLPGLSVIDLLMNEGPAAKALLAAQEAAFRAAGKG